MPIIAGFFVIIINMNRRKLDKADIMILTPFNFLHFHKICNHYFETMKTLILNVFSMFKRRIVFNFYIFVCLRFLMYDRFTPARGQSTHAMISM